MGRIQQFNSLVLLWFITFQIALSLLTQVLVLEPLLLDESFDKPLDAQSINIPATSSLSKRSLSWDDAIAKGTRLLCRLENSALLNDQSSVTSTDMVAESGWIRSIEKVDKSIFPALQSYFAQYGVVNNLGDYVGVRWMQTQATRNSQGQDVPATKAQFVNIYNVKAGFIIAYSNYGPAWQVRDKAVKTLPDVRAWSDVVFPEWQTQAQASGQDVKGLNYVIRFGIANEDTTAIIQKAAGEMINIQWPGVIIPMSDERGRAILGTPNGGGIAYLLATHKAQLGEKTIESVQVWSREVKLRYHQNLFYVYAVFKIGPVASSSGSSPTA